MLDEDRFEEVLGYVKKIHRWVLFIGVVTIFGVVLSVCSAIFVPA